MRAPSRYICLFVFLVLLASSTQLFAFIARSHGSGNPVTNQLNENDSILVKNGHSANDKTSLTQEDNFQKLETLKGEDNPKQTIAVLTHRAKSLSILNLVDSGASLTILAGSSAGPGDFIATHCASGTEPTFCRDDDGEVEIVPTRCPGEYQGSTTCSDPDETLPTQCISEGTHASTECPNSDYQKFMPTECPDRVISTNCIGRDRAATVCPLDGRTLPTECPDAPPLPSNCPDDEVDVSTFCPPGYVMPTQCEASRIIPTTCPEGIITPTQCSHEYEGPVTVPTQCVGFGTLPTTCPEGRTPTLCVHEPDGSRTVPTQCPDGSSHGCGQ